MGKELNNDPEKRPVTLVVRAPDDTLFQKEYALSFYTEGWQPKFQKWEKQGRVEFKNEHKIYTMLLESPKAIPHIRAFKFVPID